jgi:hypothetical protein
METRDSREAMKTKILFLSREWRMETGDYRLNYSLSAKTGGRHTGLLGWNTRRRLLKQK